MDEEGGDGRKLAVRSTCAAGCEVAHCPIDKQGSGCKLGPQASFHSSVLRLEGPQGGGAWGGKMFCRGDTAPWRRLVCTPKETSCCLPGGQARL